MQLHKEKIGLLDGGITTNDGEIKIDDYNVGCKIYLYKREHTLRMPKSSFNNIPQEHYKQKRLSTKLSPIKPLQDFGQPSDDNTLATVNKVRSKIFLHNDDETNE